MRRCEGEQSEGTRRSGGIAIPLLMLHLTVLAAIVIGGCAVEGRSEAGRGADEKRGGGKEESAEDVRSVRQRTILLQGTNHAHIHRRRYGYGSERSASVLQHLSDLGANAVALTPFAYQQRADAPEVYGYGPDDPGETPDPTMRVDDVAAEVASAKEAGLAVVLKPHIWAGDFHDGEEWHGSIRQNSPEEHARWFASYRRFILGWARFAEEHEVEVLSLGTELVAMTLGYPDEWRELIGEVRTIYSGLLTYTAHWDREYHEIAFWDDLDLIGVAAYFPLDAPADASVDDLIGAWGPWIAEIDSIADRFDRDWAFLEVGYRPVSATWHEPWTYDGGTPDSSAQIRAYTALFSVLETSPRSIGHLIWKTFTDLPEGSRQGEQTGFSLLSSPAESTITSSWHRTRTLNPQF